MLSSPFRAIVKIISRVSRFGRFYIEPVKRSKTTTILVTELIHGRAALILYHQVQDAFLPLFYWFKLLGIDLSNKSRPHHPMYFIFEVAMMLLSLSACTATIVLTIEANFGSHRESGVKMSRSFVIDYTGDFVYTVALSVFTQDYYISFVVAHGHDCGIYSWKFSFSSFPKNAISFEDLFS